jgi:hypothetical protein
MTPARAWRGVFVGQWEAERGFPRAQWAPDVDYLNWCGLGDSLISAQRNPLPFYPVHQL